MKTNKLGHDPHHPEVPVIARWNADSPEASEALPGRRAATIKGTKA